MFTKSTYQSTITMTDIAALLLAELREEYDAPDLQVEDLTIKYDEDAETFSVTTDLQWETDLSSDDQEDFEFEVTIPRDRCLRYTELMEATDNDRSSWPRVGTEIVMVDRDGVETEAKVRRIDDDGELFVDDPNDSSNLLSVTNYDADDVDSDYQWSEIKAIRWSATKTKNG